MFDQLINLVKEHAGSAIINNTDVPNENNDAVINTTATGIMDHLKNLAGSGGIEKITSLFSGNDSDNSEVSNMSSTIATTISEKFGLDPGKAAGIVENLVPTVMSNLKSKTNDPNDSSFTMDGILGSITGGSGGLGGILNSVKNLF